MTKFYPNKVVERKYSIAMLHYLAYLFPDKKFSLHEYDMYDAMFMKRFDEGYSMRVEEESEEKKDENKIYIGRFKRY